ncbi:hypothetical protein Tco_0803337 [Tanacetum coccineum]|uniref:Uncharacterized protein n=1 Tax=Tanacetum coccineum TaxID=301880 RepID=A0ABQ5A1A1_9ASTR
MKVPLREITSAIKNDNLTMLGDQNDIFPQERRYGGARIRSRNGERSHTIISEAWRLKRKSFQFRGKDSIKGVSFSKKRLGNVEVRLIITSEDGVGLSLTASDWLAIRRFRILQFFTKDIVFDGLRSTFWDLEDWSDDGVIAVG